VDFVWEHLYLWLKTNFNYSCGAFQNVKITTVGCWLKSYCSLLLLLIVFHFTKSFKLQIIFIVFMLCFLRSFFFFFACFKISERPTCEIQSCDPISAHSMFSPYLWWKESLRLRLSLVLHFIFGMVVLMVVDKFSTTHVSHRPHIHLRRMSKKAGEEQKNACYSFTTLASQPISSSANTRTKPKIIKINLQTVVDG
jgi:hypothetical protein